MTVAGQYAASQGEHRKLEKAWRTKAKACGSSVFGADSFLVFRAATGLAKAGSPEKVGLDFSAGFRPARCRCLRSGEAHQPIPVLRI